MFEDRKVESDDAVGRLDEEAVGSKDFAVLPSRYQRDVVTMLSKPSADNSAHPASAEDDESHLW